MRKHPSELSFEKGETEVGSGPMNLMVAAAGECNLSCFMCGQSIVEKLPVSINVERMSKFLESAENLTVTGGEPLWISGNTNEMSRKFLEIDEKKYPQLKISAYTNGLYLTPSLAEIIIDKFRWIYFSIDTIDPAVFKKIRGKDTLAKVLANFEMLLSMKKKRGLGKNDEPHICVSSIVCKSTIRGFVDLSEYLSDKAVRLHSFVKLRNVLGYEYINEINTASGILDKELLRDEMLKEIIEPGDVDRETVQNIVSRLIELNKKTGLAMEDTSGIFAKKKVRENEDTRTASACPLPWTTAEIHSNGDVYFCCVNTVVLGNINRDSFDEIWNGPTIKSIRRAFLNGEMRGCIQESCGASVDYFSNRDAYSQDIYDSFAKTKVNEIKSILLLRTAPLYQSRITALTLQKRFPQAKLTIVSNPAGISACKEWNDGWKTVEYPGASFTPEVFTDWWKNRNHVKCDLAIAPYNTDSSKDCSNINETLSMLEAESKYMVSIDGQLQKI
jgi:MoaA/NifB/PqqE/SkfB family radical SAM enzyme